MVHVAVGALIGAHGDDDVAQGRVRVELPVVDGDLGRRDVGVAARIHFGEILRVGEDGLLLEIADHAVRRALVHRVEQAVADQEAELRDQDHGALQPVGLGDLDEGHQVHALVFGLVEQGADPALVVTHLAQGVQVLRHAADHAGHACDGFQHHGAVAVALGEKRVGDGAHGLGEAEGDAVRDGLGRDMDIEHDCPAAVGIELGLGRRRARVVGGRALGRLLVLDRAVARLLRISQRIGHGGPGERFLRAVRKARRWRGVGVAARLFHVLQHGGATRARNGSSSSGARQLCKAATA